MYIEKIKIYNFKCFEEFSLNLKDGLNILVGDNEAGKSTILEAIHLALTGLLNGKYLKLELTPDLFNNQTKRKYIKSLHKTILPEAIPVPPEIVIELYFNGFKPEDDSLKALFEGTGNTDKTKSCGIKFKINFNETYREYYEELVKQDDAIQSIPTEYYEFSWASFARDEKVTPFNIPIKSAPIDSSTIRYKSGSDVYISRIVRDHLENEDKIKVDHAYRRLKDKFIEDSSIKNVNEVIKKAIDISSKKVEISLDLSVNAWETSLTTYLDDVPFHYIGKGEQCVVKTKLALSHKKSQEANVLLIEELENHLSYTKLNSLIGDIKKNSKKQIIISTHSSFVANKLGLDHIIMINVKADRSTRAIAMLKDLSNDTQLFFEKLSGYDTLRLILCKKAILVEGDSDELIIQRAYLDKFTRLPIENQIDVISVGTAFLRFLEIADKLDKNTCVVTDNDGDYKTKIENKYSKYKDSECIKICYDKNDDLNTLEPQLVEANSDNLDNLRKVLDILEKNYPGKDDIIKYMINNKTKSALKIFQSEECINYPEYILNAIKGGDDS